MDMLKKAQSEVCTNCTSQAGNVLTAVASRISVRSNCTLEDAQRKMAHMPIPERVVHPLFPNVFE